VEPAAAVERIAVVTEIVKDRWLGERGGPQSLVPGNRLWKKPDVAGALLPCPVPQPNRMSLEQLSGTSAWRVLNPTHKQMLASFLYGDVSMADIVKAFGTVDEKKAEKIAQDILSRADVQAVIRLLEGKA
jgi:hypothetical protein